MSNKYTFLTMRCPKCGGRAKGARGDLRHDEFGYCTNCPSAYKYNPNFNWTEDWKQVSNHVENLRMVEESVEKLAPWIVIIFCIMLIVAGVIIAGFVHDLLYPAIHNVTKAK